MERSVPSVLFAAASHRDDADAQVNMAAFAVLSNTGKMTFDLADGAMRELNGSTLVTYGRHRKKLRSGF